jgi:hypothetical protein
MYLLEGRMTKQGEKMEHYLDYTYITEGSTEIPMVIKYYWDSVLLPYPDPKDPYSQAEDPTGDIEVDSIEIDWNELEKYELNKMVISHYFKIYKEELETLFNNELRSELHQIALNNLED